MEKSEKPHQYRHYVLLIFLIVAACGNNRRPGLSDKELFAQRAFDTLQETKQVPDFSDMENYVVQPGIKYTESRAVDPANPPIVIDIANRNLNIRKFNLSDYYTKVRYIKIKHPLPASENSFLIDISNSMMTPHEIWRHKNIFPSLYVQFIFSDDYIVAGDICSGLYCYHREGEFLYTIETNDFPRFSNTYNSRNYISFDGTTFKGFYGRVTAYGNNYLYTVIEDNKSWLCMYDLTQGKRIMTRPFEGSRSFILDHQSMADYVYEPVRTPEDFLFTFDLKGDTLCRFPNYNPIPVMSGGSYPSPPSPDIYYHRGQLTVRQTLNDTVYRVTSPNRLIPAYVLNFGAYGADAPTFFRGNLSEKLLPNSWSEADRYILFFYSQNRDTPNNRRSGSVQFFYSYYDKKTRQLYHFTERTSIPPDQFFMDNPIPDALPFIWTYAEIEDQQLRVFYTKKRLEEISNTKEFATLSLEQQNKLKTLQNEFEDNEVLIMILE